MKLKKRYRFLLVFALVILSGFLIPEPRTIPVEGATRNDWHSDTYWYEPWGSSGVHKGIDIFAKQSTPVIASTHLLVLYRGQFAKGGNVTIALGPKWRVHYYAHLDKFNANDEYFIKAGEVIGSVGTSGNAKGKAPHLHYSIVTLIPYLWRIDTDTQGYKKMLYLDPGEYLTAP